MYEHKSSVSKDGKKPTPVSRHFSSDGHSQKHMQFSVLEWCTPKFESDSTSIRRHIELCWIFELHSLSPIGINQFVWDFMAIILAVVHSAVTNFSSKLSFDFIYLSESGKKFVKWGWHLVINLQKYKRNFFVLKVSWTYAYHVWVYNTAPRDVSQHKCWILYKIYINEMCGYS